jgi:hypothetical protein
MSAVSASVTPPEVFPGRGGTGRGKRDIREMLTFGNLSSKGTIPERRKDKGKRCLTQTCPPAVRRGAQGPQGQKRLVPQDEGERKKEKEQTRIQEPEDGRKSVRFGLNDPKTQRR